MDYASQYKRAVKRDGDVRDAAYLELTTPIYGIEIRQMDVRDFLILDGLGNPLLYGGLPNETQLTAFLWLLSPDWKAGKRAAFWFARRVRKLTRNYSFGVLFAKVSEYTEDTFQDAPGGLLGGGDGETFKSVGADYVHLMAKHYGWTWQQTIHTPLKILFQQVKCIRLDNGKKDTRSRRLLKLSGDRLRALSGVSDGRATN